MTPVTGTPPRQDQLRLFHFPAPACWECKVPAMPFITRQYNSNGNAGRPYYKCLRCPGRDALYTFADDRNVGPPNPLCYCGRYSRGERTGAAKGRTLFYKCWDMKCRFWEWEGEQDTHSDASSTPSPPKASSSQGLRAPAVKVEKNDPFRTPPSAVTAPTSDVFHFQPRPPVKVEKTEPFRFPSAVAAPTSHIFQFQSPVKTEKSDAFQSPLSAAAASNSNMFQFQSPPPIKVEKSDPFRPPPSAVAAAPVNYVFQSPPP